MAMKSHFKRLSTAKLMSGLVPVLKQKIEDKKEEEKKAPYYIKHRRTLNLHANFIDMNPAIVKERAQRMANMYEKLIGAKMQEASRQQFISNVNHGRRVSI